MNVWWYGNFVALVSIGDASSTYAITSFGDTPQSDACGGHTTQTANQTVWHANVQFVFSVTAGHSGSTAFGSESQYEVSDGGTLCSSFEAEHLLRFRGGVDSNHCKCTFSGPLCSKLKHPCGISGWFESTRLQAFDAGGSRPGCFFAREAERYVSNDLIPHYKLVQRDKCEGNASRVFMDLGHHLLFGVMDALVHILGISRVWLVRIRRARLANAVSYYVEKKIPCSGNGMYVLCPKSHGSILFADMKKDKAHSRWKLANALERCLWLIDEVEARWQSLLLANPKLSRREINWIDANDFSAGADVIAEALTSAYHVAGNLQTVVRAKDRLRNMRIHTANKMVTRSEIQRMTKHYWQTMQYSPRALRLISKQQFD